MLQLFREIAGHREFLREYVLLQLRARYRGSVLGFVWTLLNPLMISAAFVFLFSKVNRVPAAEFIPHFLSGYLPWTFFVMSATMANGIIIGNSAFVTRAYVPKGIFPLSVVLLNAVDLLAGVAVYFVVVGIVAPHRITPTVLFLPVAAAVLFAFVTGVSFFFAAINVFFRDFQFIWATISFLWFFMLPILFLPQNSPAMVRNLQQFNIMYPLVLMFQDPLAHGVLPSPEMIGASILYSGLALVIGATAFFRWQREFYMYV